MENYKPISAELYALKVSDHRTWVYIANLLRYSGEYILNGHPLEFIESDDVEEFKNRHFKIMTFRPAWMLLGMAMENIVKGLIAYQNKEKFVKNGKQPKMMTGHCLETLFKQASISVNQTELDLLNRMTKQIVVWGRYPVPTSASKLPANHNVSFSDSDRVTYTALYQLVFDSFGP